MPLVLLLDGDVPGAAVLQEARRWEPKRLRLRLFTIPASLARTGRPALLHLAARAPWADLARHAELRLRALAVHG